MPSRGSQDDLEVYKLLVEIKEDIGELTGTIRAHIQHDQESFARLTERLDRLETARAADATGALVAVKSASDKTKDMLWKVAGSVGLAALGAVGAVIAHAFGLK